MGRHTSDAKLVQSDVDWLASLAQAGTLHKGVPTTVLTDELAYFAVRMDAKETYLNISIGRKVHALADLPAVFFLRRYRQLVTSRIETKGLWIALWTGRSARHARRTAASMARLGARDMSARDMRTTTLRGVTRVGARRVLRTVARTGVGGAVKRRNSQVTRHADFGKHKLEVC